jgi:hypothetical protein
MHATDPTVSAHGSSLGTNPVVGVLRTLGLLLSGRVRFNRAVIGRLLETDDGVRYRVFRRAVVRRDAPPPEALFIVRFTPHMRPAANIRFSLLPMLLILGFTGFRSKFWCVNDGTGACEGVYEWQTRVDAEAYAASIALRFMTNRSVPGSVSHRILERTDDAPWPFRLVPPDAAR